MATLGTKPFFPSLSTICASTCRGSERRGAPSSLNMVSTSCARSTPVAVNTGTRDSGTARHHPSRSPLSSAIRDTSRPHASCATADLGSLMPSESSAGSFSIGNHLPRAAPLQSVMRASTVSMSGCWASSVSAFECIWGFSVEVASLTAWAQPHQSRGAVRQWLSQAARTLLG